MKHLLKKSLYVGALLCATTLSSNAMAQANVATVGANVTVNNTITATLSGGGLNFGVVALIPGTDAVGGTDDTLSASATVSSGGVLTASGTAGSSGDGDTDAIGAVVDDTNAAAALINISDAVDAATLNITIDSVSVPTAGFNTLGLDGFLTSFNGGTQGTRNLSSGAVTFTETFSAGFNSGVNTLSIGGTITAAEGATINQTVPYDGTFDVTVSY